ncbi:hypothetical protein [Micromonospora polyrhachis]|uniref:Uncharacterized protein n=1 Tax=Micromonospora polyrhachis TaxID=1282883 RepID=A0A7W7WN79_9ACTN|nr:hypothetical protein [Micromonospora polyrhachis]MBB4956943.1 hypothetical protein [Micromonospora polyrhachis]
MAGKYGDWTLNRVQAAIDQGAEAPFTEGGDHFAKLYSALEKASAGFVDELKKVPTYWTGPAAEAFAPVLREVAAFIVAVREPMKGYPDALDDAKKAWQDAKRDIDQLKLNRDRYVEAEILANRTPNTANFDRSAQQILETLGGRYETAIASLKLIPTSPDKVQSTGTSSNGGSGGSDGDGDGDKNGNEDDEEGNGTEDEEDKEDEEGKGAGEEEEKKGEGGGSGDGGGGSPSGGGTEGDPGGGEGGDPGEGSAGEGSEGSGGSGSGPGPGTGVPGRLSDTNRALPNAPRTKDRNGNVTGIDVDGDGVPDLGLDGKPLPDATLVELGGVKGVDVDGDGRPDIGVDGEILAHAPIVQGPDGTIGIDVDGDGEPDVGISGQILPDAPIVTRDGIRGVDVDGDGVPDLGMDRKPLPDAKIVEVDGVKGVDVDGDGKPDIGMQGEILDFAPMVSTPDGLTGVDVNGDGKPDIAVLGGISVPVERGIQALGSPNLPVTPQTQGQSPVTSLTSAGLGGQTVTYAPNYDDPPTVLTSLGAAVASSTRVVAVDGAPHGGNPAWSGTQAMPYGAGVGAPTGSSRAQRWTSVAEDDDAWRDDRGANSALGRPAYDDEWED